MSLYTYLTTNVIDTFAEMLGIRNHHVDVIVDVVDGVGADVVSTGPGFILCITGFEAVPGHESIQSPLGGSATG